ncbi:hypothetical protein SAMN05421538_103174 [Paracoccus isoporae]|uniref:Uncharacterized protein n=1 Tax=Paracoccus isoporae TaxID=591205 RepID=A0A1G6Z8E8_9RHOB|nr:hypothetical protein [Paracoccus isoporae]SDD98267.1 hypothetical protein SAMN05421538_103174 [Paracoccus isoporae]
MTMTVILPLIPAILMLPLAFYCWLLSRRLRRLNNLETGLGGAIAVMTTEISRLDRAIREARAEATSAGEELLKAVEKARGERAYWALQSELTQSARPPARRLRRRATVTEQADA